VADNLYLPQVDYTSRDYASLSKDLKALIPNFAPQWTSRDSGDFGIVLLELFAYLGDLLNYQIDRAANEAFISTATQRDTVLNLAKLLNYIPNDVNAATGTVTLSNSGATEATIAAGTEVSTTADGINPAVTFTLNEAVNVPAQVGIVNGTASVAVTQGKSTTETVGTSTGTPNQEFPLSNTGVITGAGITVTVAGITYSKINFIIDANSTDAVYYTYTDGAGITYVVFGDGISGRIPPNGSSISVTYRYSETSGSVGNVAANSVKNINIFGIAVTNELGFSGGTDAESTDSVRVNAPLSLRALDRAVSLKDYSSLAVQFNGVEKANAMATSLASIVLFIAASGGRLTTTAFKQTVYDYFVDKIPPGTTVSIQDFTAVYPYLTVTVQVRSQYNAALVGAAVGDALETLLNFANVTFNDLITLGDIYATCNAVDGVEYVIINDFEKFISNPSSGSGIYSQTATLETNATTGSTVLIVDSTSGLWSSGTVKPRIISPTAFNNATISSLAGTSANITAVSYTSAGTVITYTASNTFVPGQTVAVTGATSTQYNVTLPIASATATQFTIVATAAGGSTSTAVANATTGGVNISAAPSSTVSSGTAIVIQGFGNVADLSCSVNEVPILESSYINIITTGGAS
jgi:hypothetical protein